MKPNCSHFKQHIHVLPDTDSKINTVSVSRPLICNSSLLYSSPKMATQFQSSYVQFLCLFIAVV